MNMRTKLEVRSFTRSVHEIIKGAQKFGQSVDTPTLPFLQNFEWALLRMDPVNVPAKFDIANSPLPDITAEFWVGVANAQSIGKGRPYGRGRSRVVPFERALMRSPIGPP